MKYKLLASDLDDTIIPYHYMHLSQTIIDTLNYITDTGMLFALCTGRSTKNMPDNINDIKNISFIIHTNGATIIDCKKQEVIFNATMPKSIYKDLLSMMDDMEGMIMYFIDGDICADYKYLKMYKDDPLFNEHFAHISLIKNLNELIINENKQIKKAAVIARKENIVKINEKINKVLPELDTTSHNETNIEIIPKNINKGSALKFIANYLNISTDEMIMLGDSSNDVEAFDIAGLSIAPVNSYDIIKEKADIIGGDCHDDSFAIFIKETIEKLNKNNVD